MGENAKKFVSIRGQRMAYVERGRGPALVFLHGNPTSSFLWRHQIAPLSRSYRCLAPDLIGMGDSDKLPETGASAYAYATHQAYVDAWFDAVLPRESVVLVLHDWGSALGFDWARRHPERVRGIAYMEAILGALPLRALPEAAQRFFAAIRSPAGEPLVLDENVFVERMLSPESTLVPLSAADADEYRRPFREPGEGRRPTLSWPRLLPYDGEPTEIVALADRYRSWLKTSPLPKLLVIAEPGRILTPELLAECRSFPNQREITVPGLHYPQEDSPQQITTALEAWLPTLAGAKAAIAS
jgi:haloalkane dehalogenase